MEKRKNIDAFSLIKLCAAFGVVLLHVAYSSYLLFRNGYSVSQNSALLSITNALRFCVPLFVTVTGALLLDPEKQISIKTVWTKYIARILISLLVFSALFFTFDLVMNSDTLNAQYILGAVKKLYTADGWGHLWYMYLLVWLYILLPFLKMVVSKAEDRELRYLIFIYFAFVCVLPLTEFFGWTPGYLEYAGSVYPLYLLLGYALYKRIIAPKPIVSLAVFILCEVLTVVLNIISDSRGIENLGIFWNYRSPVTVLAVASCFSLFLNIGELKDGVLKRIIISADRCSLGIYLLHMLFVRLLLRYIGMNPLEYGGIFGIIALSVIIFAVTFALIRLLKFIPGVRKIV